MHIYVEESGEPGPIIRLSGTRHFVLAALVVPDREQVTNAILKLRQKHNFSYEFKSNTPAKYQTSLLRLAASSDISVAVMVVDKTSLPPQWQRRKGLALYQAVAEAFLPAVAASLQKAILVMDEVNPKQTERIRQVIQQKVNPRRPSKDNPRRIKKIRGANSKSDDLLQLAHVVAWAVFRSKERGDQRYLKVIESRITWYQFGG